MTRNRSALKKALFTVVANLIGLTVVLCAAEFASRWRAEQGFRGAWRTLFANAAPLNEMRAGAALVPDPDLGFRYNPAMPGINSLGIRHPEIAVPKPAGLRRIIVLGDSVAAGTEGFVSLVREQLPHDTEVINAAIGGYTTYQERRLLERDLLRTSPDLVILQYCLNDNHQFLHRFDAENQMLLTEEARRTLVPTGGGLPSALARRSYLAFRMRMVLLEWRTRGLVPDYPWEGAVDVGAAWQDESWKMFEEHLAAMNSQLRGIGARLAVVMAPLQPQLEEQFRTKDLHYVLKPQRKITQICVTFGVPLLDLYPVLLHRGGPRLFSDHYHLTQSGHRVVAEALLHFLREQGLL